MGVEEKTPGYLVKEKLQQNKLKGKAGRRAWTFEERLEKRESDIERKCLEEMKKKVEKEE